MPGKINFMFLKIRDDKFYVVYGGPYVQKPRNMTGVKMAVEIGFHGDGSKEISVPTKDFSIPDVALMRKGLIAAVREIIKGRPVYAGCKGGIGRTGLCLALLAKSFGYTSPIAHVRSEYYEHAVETNDQMQFVANFKIPKQVIWMVRWARFKSLFRLRDNLTRF